MSEQADVRGGRGRRRAGADTRAALLSAAREVFAERGYDNATLRAIATRAGVDAAMVNHWFGGKDGLFAAAVELPVNPDDVIRRALADGPREQVAERLVRTFVTVWDTLGGGGFIALVRSASSHPRAAAMLREFLSRVVFGRVTRELRVDQPEMRAALCGSQLAGLGLMRYVVALEPLASADVEFVVAAVAPNIQRYLTGDLPARP